MSDSQTNKIPSVADFGKENTLPGTDEKGKQVRYVLLSDGRIASIREGKGKDVEQATMISGGDQTKYFSAMMAATIEIDGKGIVMEDLSELGMKDYMRLQVAFADINF